MNNFNPQSNSTNPGDDLIFAEPKLPKLRDRAFSDMRYVEYLKKTGMPPAPLHKPQITPEDIDEIPTDMQLPPCELEDQEGKKKLTSPFGLNAICEETASDEEEEKDKIYVSEKPSRESGMAIESKKAENLPTMLPIRFRSRSENITSCSIFKFMENSNPSHKGQGGVKSFF